MLLAWALWQGPLLDPGLALFVGLALWAEWQIPRPLAARGATPCLLLALGAAATGVAAAALVVAATVAVRLARMARAPMWPRPPLAMLGLDCLASGAIYLISVLHSAHVFDAGPRGVGNVWLGTLVAVLGLMLVFLVTNFAFSLVARALAHGPHALRHVGRGWRPLTLRYLAIILALWGLALAQQVAGRPIAVGTFLMAYFAGLLVVRRQVLQVERQRERFWIIAVQAEAKDRDTHFHLDRVSNLSMAIADRLGLARHAVEEVGYASRLHDVGKLRTPNGILKKPGALTPEEWSVMQRHTTDGWTSLSRETGMAMAADVALSHHERYDGQGYPNGLAGEAIPLAARIVSVADSYDAMVWNRVYRRGMPPQAARGVLRAERDRQFDGRVVDAALAVLERGDERAFALSTVAPEFCFLNY